MVKIGCCGFSKGRKAYFNNFDLVEVQKTFYKPPKVSTAEKWREESPEDFEFTIKAWQLITHLPSSPTYRKARIEGPEGKKKSYGFFKPTEEVFDAWDRTIEIAEELNATTIVFQCPGSFKESEENINNMKEFFKEINKNKAQNKGYLFAWEPRGGWSEETIKRLCKELHLIHCVDPLINNSLHGKPQYYRLHGGKSYKHKYTYPELQKVSEIARDDCYVLFNNMYMLEDALRFKELLVNE